MRRFAWLCALLAACPESGDPQAIDAADVDAPATDAREVPTGTSHGFVAATLDLPENAAEATQLGLDIDERPNDGVDNQLGMVLGSIGALAPDLDLQVAAQRAIDRGTNILLVELIADFQNPDPIAAAARTFEGANPMPAPCLDAGDPVCRRHLDGSGTFDLGAAASDVPIIGSITAGTFRGGGGTIVAPLTLGGATAAWVPLQRAKAELTQIGAGGFTGKIGGAVTELDLQVHVIPAIAASMREQFARDCQVGGTPPDCACTPDSTGDTLRGLFDRAPTQDCMISDTEVRDVVSGFLTPDIDLDGNGVNDALSLGVGVTVVPGSFTPPAL